MIQRVVLIKLKPEYRSDSELGQIIQRTEEVLRTAKGVVSLVIGRPSDARTRREWDLCLLVRFQNMRDVEAYRVDAVHRAYADVFLKPLREKIYVYNFEIESVHSPNQ